MPRCPGGWFDGMFHASRPGWPSSVLSSDQVRAPSRLSKTPGPRRRRAAARAPPSAPRPSRASARRPRRSPGPRSRAPRSRPGRGCARRRRRATRSPRPRRSRRTIGSWTRGRRASSRSTGPRMFQERRSASLSSTKQPFRVPTSSSVCGIARPPVSESAVRRLRPLSGGNSSLGRAHRVRPRDLHPALARRSRQQAHARLRLGQHGRGDRSRARGADAIRRSSSAGSAISSAWRSRMGASSSTTASATSTL